MGTQTAIATQIYNAKADYVLALKANHPTLYGQVKDWFEQAIAQGFEGVNFSYDERVEKDIIVLKSVKFGVFQFLNYHLYIIKMIRLKCVVMVVRLRNLWKTKPVRFNFI